MFEDLPLFPEQASSYAGAVDAIPITTLDSSPSAPPLSPLSPGAVPPRRPITSVIEASAQESMLAMTCLTRV